MVDCQGESDRGLVDRGDTEGKAAGSFEEMRRDLRSGERESEVLFVYIAHNVEREHARSVCLGDADK